MVKPQNVKACEIQKIVNSWAKKTHKQRVHAIVQNYLKLSRQAVRRSASSTTTMQCNEVASNVRRQLDMTASNSSNNDTSSTPMGKISFSMSSTFLPFTTYKHVYKHGFYIFIPDSGESSNGSNMSSVSVNSTVSQNSLGDLQSVEEQSQVLQLV